MCQHLIGKNIKHYGVDHVLWGTDCLWWGSPQWVIDAFKRFQISDELCEKFGYQKLTKDDKAKIFGLNAAKIYGVDVKAQRQALPADTLSKLKQTYLSQGGQRANAAYGWVRADALRPRSQAMLVVAALRWHLRRAVAQLPAQHVRSRSIRRRGAAITSASPCRSSPRATSACSAIAWTSGRPGPPIATDKPCARPIPGLTHFKRSPNCRS